MTTSFGFTRFSSDDLAAYRAWFADPATAQRLSAPDADWFRYVTSGPAEAWAVRDRRGALVAVVEVEADDAEPARGYVAVTVDPARRRQGIGRGVLRALPSAVVRRFKVLEGRVEPDNAASLAVTRAAGFREVGAAADADGMLRFERHV